ncbi:hypothetical protein NC652_027869 [Populus alba x Populus x berolinensis]|nr:hypothetical protein NC652_027869 [Populus alba x Populus x berolinensis]
MFLNVFAFTLVAICYDSYYDHAIHVLDIVLQLLSKLTSFNSIQLDSC